MKLCAVLLVGFCLLVESGKCKRANLKRSVQYAEVSSFFEWTGIQDKLEELSTTFPFQNTSLSFNDRVEDLVNRLTLDELVQQMSMGGAFIDGPAPAISRLGIKPYQWNTECLRGYAFANDATCFPQPIGLAATFDPHLIEDMAKVISWEARAKSHNFSIHNEYQDHTGLSCFSPVINIMRHPLWGRNQETYGEDPYLTSMFAKHYVHGLQGTNDRYAAATAVCKHFDVHGGPEDKPTSRLNFTAVVTERDWQMTFLPAFRACVEAGAYGVMCSYNAINGVPACANKKLLTDILRTELGFTGYVVSDEGAIEHIDLLFNYTSTPLKTAVASVSAGVNLELTYFGPKNRFFLLKEAVEKKLIDVELLKKRVKPLFYTRFKLGEFDPPSMNPYSTVSTSVVQIPEHRELANTVASKSFVLLKNNGVLPLKGVFKKATVIGPFAKNSEALTGDYPAQFDMKYFSSPYDGVQKLTSDAAVAVKGCTGDFWDKNLAKCPHFSEDDVKKSIPGSDLVVITLGTGTAVEAEGKDRANITLPGEQLDLLKSVVQYADKSAKIVVLLFNAGPLDVSWAKTSPNVHAMLACHFPAQSAGEALYRVLSGQENPAARLPNTWPASLSQVPPITNYSMNERTYRYSTTDPLFPFGYGLSYTIFEYLDLQIGGGSFSICDAVGVSVLLQNKGSGDGEEVVQVYMSWTNATVEVPNLQLVAFKRIALAVNEVVHLDFTISPEQRAVWKDQLMLEPGQFEVFVGGQQPHQKTQVPSNVLEKAFAIGGSAKPLDYCYK